MEQIPFSVSDTHILASRVLETLLNGDLERLDKFCDTGLMVSYDVLAYNKHDSIYVHRCQRQFNLTGKMPSLPQCALLKSTIVFSITLKCPVVICCQLLTAEQFNKEIQNATLFPR